MFQIMVYSLFISSNQTIGIAVNEQTHAMLCGGDVFLIIVLIFNTQYHVIFMWANYKGSWPVH